MAGVSSKGRDGRLLAVAASAILIAGASGQAHAGPVRRVVLAVDGVLQTRNLPVLLAERLGYFRDEGLAVTLVDSLGDPGVDDLVRDGRADGAVAFYHHTFMSQADDGVVTQAVVLMGVTPGLRLMVASRLKGRVSRVADLKGLRIYAGGANSGKTTAANWLVTHAGLRADDYVRLPNVAPDRMGEALSAGTADAIVAHEPDASAYEAAGLAFPLADLESVAGTRAALGEVYPSTALYLTRSFIAAHPAEVDGLARASVRALAYLNRHSPDEVAAVLPAKMAGKDKAAFVALLRRDMQMFATDGRTPPAAARREWQVMSALTPKYGAVRFEATYTNAYVDRALERAR